MPRLFNYYDVLTYKYEGNSHRLSLPHLAYHLEQQYQKKYQHSGDSFNRINGNQASKSKKLEYPDR